jgi:L-seryl-tRNA(Ser) seleniumtransferase
MSESKNSAPSQRAIPSVDQMVRALNIADLPRPVVVQVIRRELAKLRASKNGEQSPLQNVREAIDALRLSRIQPVINATGIVIHTNLGRSPLGGETAAAVVDAATQFTNLEYDLSEGSRGRRGSYVEHNLAVLCASEAATVVNNCAAALVLVLRHFAAAPPRNQVIISRGELIQIGGGFRIPEILEASGAVLREVGTTNKTTAVDYRRAIGPETALILKVHHSNFYMGGFVESPSTDQIAMIAREADVPFLEDIGSGATFDTTTLGGPEREPMPANSIAAGADLVCFSGDKLFGGPQAGIIAGSSSHIAALKTNPFFRALRCDKLILSAMQTTVDQILSNQTGRIPIRAMMQIDLSELRNRAQKIIEALSDLPIQMEIGAGESQVGAGSLPRTILPSVTISIRPGNTALTIPAIGKNLRLGQTPVISFIQQDRLLLDLRTVFPAQDSVLVSAVRAAVTPPSS